MDIKQLESVTFDHFEIDILRAFSSGLFDERKEAGFTTLDHSFKLYTLKTKLELAHSNIVKKENDSL